jgi:hypothetical protein
MTRRRQSGSGQMIQGLLGAWFSLLYDLRGTTPRHPMTFK